jgi:hypothetical protein
MLIHGDKVLAMHHPHFVPVLADDTGLPARSVMRMIKPSWDKARVARYIQKHGHYAGRIVAKLQGEDWYNSHYCSAMSA